LGGGGCWGRGGCGIVRGVGVFFDFPGEGCWLWCCLGELKLGLLLGGRLNPKNLPSRRPFSPSPPWVFEGGRKAPHSIQNFPGGDQLIPKKKLTEGSFVPETLAGRENN